MRQGEGRLGRVEPAIKTIFWGVLEAEQQRESDEEREEMFDLVPGVKPLTGVGRWRVSMTETLTYRNA